MIFVRHRGRELVGPTVPYEREVIMVRKKRESFKRLSHEYIVSERKRGVKNVDILNSYTQKEIHEWFCRGMVGYYLEEKDVWGFSPVDAEFCRHGDWGVIEGVYRIFDNSQITSRTRKYIREAVLKLLAKAPTNEKNRVLFRDLCRMVASLTPATKILQTVSSLLRDSTEKDYQETLCEICCMVICIAKQAPKSSARMLHKIL